MVTTINGGYMRKNIIILLILTAILILSCNIDEYEITVINKSSYPIDFDFITGHRLNEKLHLDPEGEWHHSLLKSFGHSMGTFTPETNVDYSYSEYVYTFYDLPPDENSEPEPNPETEPESEP